MDNQTSNPADAMLNDAEGRQLVQGIISRTLKPGDKVRTRKDGKAWWTVQVSGSRYAIMTRQAPFQPTGTYLYTIIDAQEGVRGPCNLIGNGWDVSAYITPQAGWRSLHIQLLAGHIAISHRQLVTLDIVEVKAASK